MGAIISLELYVDPSMHVHDFTKFETIINKNVVADVLIGK